MKTGLIYIIKNRVNDKVYIGQTTTTLRTRFTQHFKNSTVKSRHYKLYNAIKKYGKDNFYIELLENNIPINLLDQKEIEYIEKYDSFFNGYNSTKGGDGRTICKEYDENEIIRLYTQEKKSCKEIAPLFNVSYTTIFRVLLRKGVAIRHDGRKYDLIKTKLTKMWNNGIPIQQMAIRLNCDERTIRRCVKRFGLKPRHNHKLN